MVPHEYILPSIGATGGTELGVLVPCVPRGKISKLLVVQLTGALDGFTYQFYNASAACPPGNSPTTVATGNNVPYQLYAVTPVFTVAATKSQFSQAEGSSEDGTVNLNFFYENMDNAVARTYQGTTATTTSSKTNAAGALYLKLNPLGTVAKTFGVALTVATETYT